MLRVGERMLRDGGMLRVGGEGDAKSRERGNAK